MSFGLPELIILLAIVLLLFGSTRLPKLARSLGQSMRELRDGFFSKETASADQKGEANKNTEAPPKEDGQMDYYRSNTEYTRR
ncbi:MAG TPA: twin-arginine translocase TatA/TatE family subunit [Candidatus Saccharimonadales bacterium]